MESLAICCELHQLFLTFMTLMGLGLPFALWWIDRQGPDRSAQKEAS